MILSSRGTALVQDSLMVVRVMLSTIGNPGDCGSCSELGAKRMTVVSPNERSE